MEKWIAHYWTKPMERGEFPDDAKYVEESFETEKEMYKQLKAQAERGSVWHCETIDPNGKCGLLAHHWIVDLKELIAD